MKLYTFNYKKRSQSFSFFLPGPQGHVSHPFSSISWQYVGHTICFRHRCLAAPPIISVCPFMNMEGRVFLPAPMPIIGVIWNPPPAIDDWMGFCNRDIPWLKGLFPTDWAVKGLGMPESDMGIKVTVKH